jgi:hypothetical protein
LRLEIRALLIFLRGERQDPIALMSRSAAAPQWIATKHAHVGYFRTKDLASHSWSGWIRFEDRARDAKALAVLRDPHALVVVDEAMGAHAYQQPVALGLDQRFGQPRDGRRMNSSQIRPHRRCAVRLGVAERRIGLVTVHQQSL